ncbi:MAG: tRNA uridine(34) 5-carboxymethylaminomethyl modification radical SAM/GNAT enzyme Elp3 [Candidatus Micrarchaeota archaeon]|nr:tRNA uridine(34) 5-carboxymethylaminomethyl modification radical SAM/GNAT enzyme Elp3 [Candidatus Micrarchaeota archaeon]
MGAPFSNSPEVIARFSKAVVSELEREPGQSIEALKIRLAPQFGISGVLKNAAIFMALPPSERTPAIRSLLRTRLTRTGSGVTPVAVMPKPFPCPGKCTYCPTAIREIDETEPPSKKGAHPLPPSTPSGKKREMFAPKAYTGFEPATMRAIQNDYDAKRQIGMRLSQYEALGQPATKCELILMGGTFLSVPKDYRHQFVKECFEAFNGEASDTLAAAQLKNESALHRVIGLTVETRPDWCTRRDIGEMLAWGATRVELGVQSLDDEVLEKVRRGHDSERAAQATADLKNAAFKVGFHFMPGLYSTHADDVRMLRRLFADSDFCPDMLKLYPCLVMPGTALYDEWKAGRFNPITTEEAVARIAEATKYFPPWVRVMRMQRDIPASKIAAGVKAGNLHQMVSRSLSEKGEKCRCIRCRETFSPYRREEGGSKKKLKLELVERQYEASGGTEHFLSFEDVEQDLLAGFIRLRLPPFSHRPEITPATALVRELHVYGQELAVGQPPSDSAGAPSGLSRSHLVSEPVQHQGLGKRLLARAQEIARAAGRNKLLIISGVGARPYYAKLGYSRDGPYVAQAL